jgi:hypothetical protein
MVVTLETAFQVFADEFTRKSLSLGSSVAITTLSFCRLYSLEHPSKYSLHSRMFTFIQLCEMSVVEVEAERTAAEILHP